MNSIQIEYFIEVVNNMSFSKAAKKLYVSQPAISKQVAALEKELGFLLIDRTQKKIKLTPAGELFFSYFIRASEDFARTQTEVKMLYEGQTGSLTIACLEGWDMSRYFPKLMSIFNQHFPGISISLTSSDFNEMIHSLNNDQTDIILTIIDDLSDYKNLNTHIITEIDQLLFFSKKHEYFEKTNLSFADFRNETFYVVSDVEGVHPKSVITSICELHGFIPKIISVSNIESMILQVESGLGVAIFDEWSRVIYNPMLRSIKTGSKHIITAVWKRSNINPLISLFFNEISFIIHNLQ